jgi:hypothetical protein
MKAFKALLNKENIMRTCELTGAALDWAVANCEKHASRHTVDVFDFNDYFFHPSTDWAQGGPIIERERLELASTDDTFDDDKWISWSEDGNHVMYGTTLLIAAMRCYVASKLGYNVKVPAELLE